MARRWTSWVDPFIGSDGAGNCLRGPYLPLGMARPGPDMPPPQRTNGYNSGNPIAHFSNTHVSGTGGGGRYGNIGLLPFTGAPDRPPAWLQPEDEQASSGYYRVRLLPDGILAELSATRRVGVFRFRFPAGKESNIQIDLGAVVQTRGGSPKNPGTSTGLSCGGFFEFLDNRRGRGRADLIGGWGHAYPYTVFFHVEFDRPAQRTLVASPQGTAEGTFINGPHSRAIAGFGAAGQVVVKVGLSFVSYALAKRNLEAEAAGLSFDRIRKQAEQTWEDALGRIEVQGATSEQKTLFYTFFSRLICMPTDLGVDDENAFWKSGVRNFTDFYCLWDSVRNANSLITLFDPDLERDILNCLLDIAEHTGWFPDFWFAGHSGHVQGGSSADVLFCEAAAKRLKGIDYDRALAFMKKNNEVSPRDPKLCGRYLDDYLGLGYVSTRVPNCVSRHIEYAYQDWCIARLAGRLGKTGVAARFDRSAQKIWNLWRADLKCFAPRNPDGSWVDPFDPFKPTRKDFWNDPYFYEGTAHNYALCALHALPELVRRHGGRDAFAAHLDAYFAGFSYHWKEIVFHTPYLYHYAGMPAKSSARAGQIVSARYKARRNGIPDNEDMGANSAVYMCSAMGLYPVMGQDLFLLSAPFFKKIKVRLGTSGKQLTVHAPAASMKNRYILSAEWNGKPLNRNWIRHTQLARGGTLTLKLGAEPGAWGSKAPPLCG